MSSDTQTAPVSTKMIWTGRVLSALPVLLLFMSAVFKLMKPAGFEKGFEDLGWSPSMATGLGIVELACAIVYAIPQTCTLGAILLTGYLGGAIATHVRLGETFIPQLLIGVVVWLGLYLRDARLRALLPLRK